MNQQMLPWRFPTHAFRTQWQTMPTLYSSSSYRFSNGFLEAGPTNFSQTAIGIGAPVEVSCTLTDVNSQLQVVDKNEVPQQQEGLSPSSDSEEESLPNEVAKREMKDTVDVTHGHFHTLSKPGDVEQSVPFENEKDPDELQSASSSSALQKRCSLFQHSSEEQRNRPGDVPHGQLVGGGCSSIAASFNQLYLREGSSQQDYRPRSDSVIQEPHHILSDAVEMLGEHLNVLMTHVHRMPSNEVKFHVEAKVWKEKDQPRRLSLTRKEPVTDPSSYDRCPEAFDCCRILRHMRKSRNLCKYAEILDCRRSEDLKREINGILGRIPGKKASRSPRPTWDSLFDTLGLMKSFIEQAVAGLTRNNEHDLAAELDKGYDSLKVITGKAVRAQRMSLQM